ncbi:MAG: glycerophosphodiester phosphodiesterase [Saprospiraceae bacterium]|nr:glycerophosphodiester phosphodiesterase [Bacteroidia bacterium]NNE15548.1 glycerophosphodiester phosphodiesterase [Saprospiraceae bacterium]NNL90872.1 glycerophosphodiester phosphodiesterase [Saprospiraceae bacterium]
MNSLDIQGHRGCRGLYPENTIDAFVHAAKLGVNTLEFDVVISKDHKVIVSHEPFMSHTICTAPDNKEITEETELDHNIYDLDYAEIKTYDSGSKYFDRFPFQKKIKTFKPSLADVIQEVSKLSRDIFFNIEIKNRPEWDTKFHPPYRQFADLVISEITNLGIFERTTVQCFQIPTLQYINQNYPQTKLVYLIDNLDTPIENLNKLGFTPHVYSPFYKLVNKSLIAFAEANKMQVIPWTVNDTIAMKDLIELGVTGIISDYPDKLINLHKELTS